MTRSGAAWARLKFSRTSSKKGEVMSSNHFLNSIRNIGDWLPGWSGWLKPGRNDAPVIPADLEVEQSGVCFIKWARRVGLPVVPAAGS